jgi:hypothetical protein
VRRRIADPIAVDARTRYLGPRDDMNNDFPQSAGDLAWRAAAWSFVTPSSTWPRAPPCHMGPTTVRLM